MSVNRRFFPLMQDNSIYTFTIDTTKIVVGATDGSQNPLTYRLPLTATSPQAFIVRVSDGRPDINYTGGGLVLTFATPGIYTISLIGRVLYYLPPTGVYGYDKLKLIEVNRWGNVSFGSGGLSGNGSFLNAFLGCLNVTIKATNPIKLPSVCSNAFKEIQGFDPAIDLSQYDASDVTGLTSMFANITMPFYSVLNPFFNKATSLSGLYSNNDMSNVPKIEIIAPLLTNVVSMLKDSQFQGELIITAPLNNIYGLLENVVNPPSFGRVDIRGVRLSGNFQRFITSTMTTANVDDTLLGWVNNFDWSGVSVISPTCNINFRSSKYSNNASVIAAKTFLENKGYVFSTLTMV